MAGRKRGAKTGSARAKSTAKKASARAQGKRGAGSKARTKAQARTKARSLAKKSTARRASAPRRAAKPASVPPGPPLSTAEKLAIVERYVAAYNARDTATILALYDAKATMSDPIGLPPAVGHKAIGELYRMGFDLNVSIAPDGAVRCAGNSVAFPLVASSPTSKLHVIDVFDFGPGGKIVEMRAYWGPDNLEGELAVRQ